MSPRLSLAAVLLATSVLGSCGGERACQLPACSPCPPPFTLSVTDAATGAPIADAVATGDAPCTTATGFPGVMCDASAVGTYVVTVSAPGYASAQVTVTVVAGAPASECECGQCAAWQPTAVALAPVM